MKEHKIIILTIIFSITSLITCGHNKEEWRSRSIYQILTDRFGTSDDSEPVCDLTKITYCGGTYKGLINHLDYIKGMGFDAIWISPIVKNTEDSYHGYHLTNLYELNEHFGTEEDFKSFIKACHEKDIWIMLDVVGNHVGPVGFDYSQVYPFNSSEYYHDNCDITDWNNQPMVENCRLAQLPDLKQENDFVTKALCDWVRDVVKKYDIDGIRIDTIPEVPRWFWDKFAAASGVYQLGEVFNANVSYVASYQTHVDALFNYPLFYSMRGAFCDNGSMLALEEYLINKRPVWSDPTILGVFLDNHDNSRFLHNCKRKKSFKNASILSLLWEGIPVYYYGGEQYFEGGDDPLNRETLWGHYDTKTDLYIDIGKVNKLRKEKKVYLEKMIQRYADNEFYAFTRGDILVALTNSDKCKKTVVYNDYKVGDKLCNILAENDCVTVQEEGITIEMGDDPKVYVKQ